MAVEITDELVALRAQAEALGIVYDGRWGEARLRDELIAARPDEFVYELETEEDSEGPDSEPAPTGAIRAGGHIDRGDGRGWMVEE